MVAMQSSSLMVCAKCGEILFATSSWQCATCSSSYVLAGDYHPSLQPTFTKMAPAIPSAEMLPVHAYTIPKHFEQPQGVRSFEPPYVLVTDARTSYTPPSMTPMFTQSQFKQPNQGMHPIRERSMPFLTITDMGTSHKPTSMTSTFAPHFEQPPQVMPHRATCMVSHPVTNVYTSHTPSMPQTFARSQLEEPQGSELNVHSMVSDNVKNFNWFLVTLRPQDKELDELSQKFINDMKTTLKACERMAEETFRADNEWRTEVWKNLGVIEAPAEKNHISIRYVCILSEMLSMLCPNGEKSRLAGLGDGQKILQAKLMLNKFREKLEYYMRPSYDSHTATDKWHSSSLSLAEEEFKREQLNAANWTTFKTLPVKTLKQFKSVYELMKSLQSLYQWFVMNEASIYCLRHLTTAIGAMVICIQAEAKIDRKVAEADKAICDLVKILNRFVTLLATPDFESNGCLQAFADYIHNSKKQKGKRFADLAVSSFIFKMCSLDSLNMFSIDPSSRNSSKERGSQVIRIKMKRPEISFSGTSYQLPQFWQNIKKSNAVDFQDAYFVLEYSTKSKKKVDDEKTTGSNAEKKKVVGRKVDGSLQYFIGATDKDARDLVKLQLAWTLRKEKREKIFKQICPELAKLESDNLSAAEDAERQAHRQKILRKKDSLKESKSQKTEELLDYLFKSEDWSRPKDKHDKKWLEKFVGGSFSFEEEKKEDKSLTDEEIWSEQIRKAIRQRFHIEFVMPGKEEHSKSKNQRMTPRKKINHLVLHSPSASAKSCGRFIAC